MPVHLGTGVLFDYFFPMPIGEIGTNFHEMATFNCVVNRVPRCFTDRSENFFSDFLYTAEGEIPDGEEPKFRDGQADILELILYP